MLPRSLRSRGSVKDVWRHFVKDVMRLNTGFGLSGDLTGHVFGRAATRARRNRLKPLSELTSGPKGPVGGLSGFSSAVTEKIENRGKNQRRQK